jgi:methyl-accepting chemotaxis protein
VKNISFIGKVITAIAVIASVAIAAVLFVGMRVHVVSSSYEDVVANEIAARRNLNSANRELAWIERSMLQIIWATSDDAIAKFAKDLDGAVKSFRDKLVETQSLRIPQRTQVQGLLDRFNSVIDGDCALALKMGKASTSLEGNASAMAEMNRVCANTFASFSADLGSFSRELSRVSQTTLATLSQTTERAILLTILATLAALGVVVAFAVVFARRSVTAPLSAVIQVMNSMEAGDLSRPVPHNDRKDEVGQIAHNLENFRQSLIAADNLRKEQEAAKLAAAEDLERRNAAAQVFASQMSEFSVGFVCSSKEVQNAALSLSAVCEQTANQTKCVATAAGKAASNVDVMASAAEELACSIKQISGKVQDVARSAEKAADETRKTELEIKALTSAAEEVGNVIELINSIAGQTKLLALNATIEATKAGDAGKGFGVVASEVKQLAGRAAAATEQISKKMADVQNATLRTADANRKIVETIDYIRDFVTTVAAALQEQSSATQMIAANTHQAAQGTTAVTANLGGIEEATQTTGVASNKLMGLSTSVAKEAERLKNQVESFVYTLRAA